MKATRPMPQATLDHEPDPCIRLRGIGKTFAGISVLRDVDLDIRSGEIHGLVGENGAGKSTLGKIIGGYYQASAGTIEVFGRQVQNWTPKDALDSGVAIMHQELQLVPELTVAENVFLGQEEERFGLLARTETDRLAPIIAATGFDIDARAKIAELPIADRQKIEVMRALARNAQVIVMDEPTSSLAADETEKLHATMRNLRDAGGTVVYVSHFLDNILSVCDRVTVLRDGDLVRTGGCAGESRESLVSAMLGGGLTEIAFPAKAAPTSPRPALEVESLASVNGVRDASFHVGCGEIVGLVGLVGSGRSEIARAVVGADRATAGKVMVHGEPFTNRTLNTATRRGIVMAPEDRRKQGLVLTLPVRANMTLPHLDTFRFAGIVNSRSERARTREAIAHFRVRPTDVDGNVHNYSGGNQQKVLLGKWLLRDPDIVILDEPSRGVDVGARQRIHEAIAEIAAKGAAVLLISSEVEEVLGLAHRAYLVSEGKIHEEIDPDDMSEGEVLRALFNLQNSAEDEAAARAVDAH